MVIDGTSPKDPVVGQPSKWPNKNGWNKWGIDPNHVSWVGAHPLSIDREFIIFNLFPTRWPPQRLWRDYKRLPQNKCHWRGRYLRVVVNDLGFTLQGSPRKHGTHLANKREVSKFGKSTDSTSAFFCWDGGICHRSQEGNLKTPSEENHGEF